MGDITLRKRALLCSAAAAMMTVGSAQAQESDAGSSSATLLDRIVLGAGQEKVAVDTPQSVTVVDQEQIDEEQPTTTGDLFANVPGVNVSGSDRVIGETFNIRGIGAPEAAADEGRIIVTVDGVNKFYEQYRLGGFFAEPDLFKRVEVLRGPASSTLYGSGALGGVINFTTKDASDFLDEGERAAFRIKTAFDSNRGGFNTLGIAALRPQDNLEFLAAGSYRRSDAYKDGDGNIIRSSGFEAPSGLVKGTVRFGPNSEQVVRASYMHWTSDANDQDYAQVTTSPGFGTVDRRVTDKTAILAYENPASDNPWLDLNVQLSFSDTTVEQENSSSAVAGTLFQDTTYGYQTTEFKVDNTFEWIGDTFENYLTVGSQTAYQQRTTDIAVPLGFHPEGDDFQTGVFVQNEFIWDERLTVIAGTRFDYQKLSPADTVPGATDESDTAFSPKIAALYKFNDTFAVFGSYAHTERFPTLDEIYSNDFPFPIPPNYSLGLQKEKSDNFELGFSVSANDILTYGDALQFKTTAFYNSITDLIVRARRNYPQYTNIGEAEIYGVEAELGYDSDYVFANAGLSIVRGRDLTNDTNLNTVAPDEVTFSIGGKLPDHYLRFGTRVRLVAAQDRVSNLPNQRLPTPGFGTVDLFASWKPEEGRFEGLEVNASIDNLLDKQYKEFLSNDPAKGISFKLAVAKTF